VLNRRGWVLQERALSRRIIHFTATQTYWECGKGVHCESLTRMHNERARLLSDPEFPESLMSRTDKNRIHLFKFLFALYSGLALTKPADRSVAILGLEKRLVRSFNTEGTHGVFQDYLHRSLLWKRSGKGMKRIAYPTNRMVPSWSWMAYTGRISYMDIPFGGVEWSNAVDFSSRKRELRAPVKEFRHCKVKLQGPQRIRCDILDDMDEDQTGGMDGMDELDEIDEATETDAGKADEIREWLIYGGQDRRNLQSVECVVIGRSKGSAYGSGDEQEYYVLLVRQTRQRCWVGSRTAYERVGVGSIQRRHISFGGREPRVRII
jgi:hypothetical protein